MVGEGASERGEGEVEVGAALVADGEAAKAGQPGQRSLDDPAVAAEPFAALDVAPSGPGRDSAGSALAPATAMIVSLVGVQLIGSALWATATAGALARHPNERGGQHAAVVAVGPVSVRPSGVPLASTMR